MNKNYKIAIAVLALVIALSGSAYAGYLYGHKRSVVISDSKQLINADFNLFWEAVDKVRQNYVDSSGVQDEKLVYGAIKGMLSAYDDPYTVFFSPTDAKKFTEDLSGNFGGIGAQLGMREGQVLVIAPLKGTPAEKAGIKPLDKIWKIDGKDTAGFLIEDAVKLIRGKVGTTVTLSIYRDGWSATKDFTITRGLIQVPTLDTKMVTLKSGKKVAVLSLYNFNANVPDLFRNAAMSALADGAQGIVLDLRNNPGGFLDVATNLSGWFMPKGSVAVIEKSRAGTSQKLFADGNAAFSKLPIVVVVNGGSASASEILAGALRDNNGAKLVGEKTFGKGSVQEVDMMSNGSTIKITIAHWYTPKGVKIDKLGLKPDVTVALTDADSAKGRDPQLDKALQIIDAEVLAKTQ